jgi:allophanate hydrolase
MAAGELTPDGVVELVLSRIAAWDDPAVFTCRLPAVGIRRQLEALEARGGAASGLPLYGVPFAVKDNIDVAGVPTTAACPAFAYTPDRSATAVERLCAAGAVVIGKTNLDQFATGLVGTRSPYGTPRNPFNADYIPGGSSSGSAVAVAAGLVSFALGTDTAGSGRVPAGLNNVVGLKPTRGRVSAAGVVPACRSLDCVSVFALTCDDAAEVLACCDAFDAADPFARPTDERDWRPAFRGRRLRVGVPRADQLKFFGDERAPELYEEAVKRLTSMGAVRVEVDFAPFAQTARLLYEGPWVAERFMVVRELLEQRPEAVLPVTGSIIDKGRELTAADAFGGLYELRRLRAAAAREVWQGIDVLALPTFGRAYRVAEVNADPIGLNSNLGYYTNFVNLLDLSALAVPAGFGTDGVPFGVTLMAPAGYDEALLALGRRFQQAAGLPLGATGLPLADARRQPPSIPPGWVRVAVMGAHLGGLPLNHQLLERGAVLERTCRTAACYRLFALPGTVPPKPGMVRVAGGAGAAIEVEVWAMSASDFGSFVASIPSPLGIGTIHLTDGTTVTGFLCEAIATEGARDISEFGGWRAFLAAQQLT